MRSRTVGASIGGAVTDTTIQSAIDAAPDGGKVCIQAGTYTASSGKYIASIRKNLTLEGADQATVLLDGQGSRCGLEIGATDYSSAITVSISNLTVKSSSGGDGSGVYVYGISGMTVTMTDVTVKDGSGVNGVTVAATTTRPVFNATRVTMTGNDIRPGTGRGGGLVSNSVATLTDCVISNNSVQTQGGGVMVFGGSTFTMSGGSLSGNHAYLIGTSYGEGGAFSVLADSASPATITLTNVSVTNNTADGRGGVGYYQGEGTTVTMTGCTVSGNTAPTCSCVYHFVSSNFVCTTTYCT